MSPGYTGIFIRAVFLLSRGAAHSWAPSHSLDLGWPTLRSWESQLTCATSKGHATTLLPVREEQPPLPWNGLTSAALIWGCIWHSHELDLPHLRQRHPAQIKPRRIQLQTHHTSPTSTGKLLTAGKTACGRARELLSHQKIKTCSLDKRSGIILSSEQR